jgi:hypothetical protein
MFHGAYRNRECYSGLPNALTACAAATKAPSAAPAARIFLLGKLDIVASLDIRPERPGLQRACSTRGWNEAAKLTHNCHHVLSPLLINQSISLIFLIIAVPDSCTPPN